MNLEYQRELAAFDEKITLAENEEAKAHERVTELKYMKSRFNLDYINSVLKQQQQQAEQNKNKEES